jgi:putative ABC transport system substrate-binding protein
MRRRKFIQGLAASTAWPLVARAEQTELPRRIAVVMATGQDTRAEARVAAFRKTLLGYGWVEGRNLHIEYRWTGGDAARINTYAAEVAGLRPDLIVCFGAPTLVALRKETRLIPIVFGFVSDPVGLGQVESLARPGGNATGFTPFIPSLGGKWVELLKEMSPTLKRVAIFLNPDTAANAPSFERPAEAAAASLGVAIMQAAIRNDTDIEPTMTSIAGVPDGGVVLVPDPFTAARYELIASAAIRQRVPLIAPFHYFTTAGGLASYGVNEEDEYQRVASYVDRILRGEKPAELPVQAPTKFELVINLKTAKLLGRTIPQSLLAGADEVIE